MHDLIVSALIVGIAALIAAAVVAVSVRYRFGR
jgi:hypothetical protein